MNDKKSTCNKCGTPLINGYCNDQACPYSDWPQRVDLELLSQMSTVAIEHLYGIKKGAPVSSFEVVRIVDNEEVRKLLSEYVLEEADDDIIATLIDVCYGYKAIPAEGLEFCFVCVRDPENCGDAFDRPDILKHAHVEVDDPGEGDTHQHAFTGTVVDVDLDNQCALVRDQEDNVFSVGLLRVSMVE